MPRIFTAVVLAAFSTSAAGLADENVVYRIGIPKSFFRDVPPELVAFAGEPFEELMKQQSGLDGKIVQDADALTVAKKIDAGELHFGVFQGHEFAWAQEKYPSLKPLVCAVYRPKEVYAVLLIRSECKAKSLADLKGKKLALTRTLKDHARLFLEKQKAERMSGGDLKAQDAETVHDGIQKLIAGEADVTVADSASWSYFQKLYPGASKGLRVLAQSDEFPPTVLAFKKDTLADDALKKIGDGFLTAHQNKKASMLMAAIHIERFDAIPAGFDKSLEACRKAYPTPLSEK
jgi:ABC-type phosphate/phosphonate transport system substrate-binding protein